MGTTVFKSIMAENFASFAERIRFTCIADESKKEHQLNTFKAGDETINKVSYVYGANGSGKTYFCKILREIQKMIGCSWPRVPPREARWAWPSASRKSSPSSTPA